MSHDYDDVLNDRAQQLLRVLVDSYIRDGQPVGSRVLSRESGLSLSSATIRNVMSDLEALGFVSSPHTSAGRVPTDRGYRFFVDTLLRRERAAADDAAGDVAQVRRPFEPGSFDSSKALVANASAMLSNVTRLAGVVTIPLVPVASISQIEFVGLSENRILVVIVFNDREVQNRIVQTTRHHSPDELRRASNYLTEQVRGRVLVEARSEILRQLQDARERMNEMMIGTIELAQQGLPPDSPGAASLEYVIAGETNLMGAAQLTSVEKLKRLFEAFNEKRDFLQLLDQSLRADGVQIFIGHESGFQVLDDCSVVTAPYRGDDGVVGVLGVIGPTRMAYERVIPIVDLSARLLGLALNSHR
jgi:heat-inducible transcriptional repressor